jgi:alpha-beta hydrolase superfamily lysophospholipase
MEDVFGTFYAYVPTILPEEPEILVVVPGTSPKDETTKWDAQYYGTTWLEFTEKNSFILLVPAFNQQDFSSWRGDHALGGYRGLFGREIGADEWVIRLVTAHQQAFSSTNEQFFLYWHSAGGQFTARFIVTHPELVKKAVISAAATYPQPRSKLIWPFGMGALHTDIEWEPESINHVDVQPDKQTWPEATQIPLTVIVGLNDTAELPLEHIPGQKGRDRITIARNWIQDMADFAEANGEGSRFKFEVIPGIGHSMSGLLPFTQGALLSQ